jgi:CrcB protein
MQITTLLLIGLGSFIGGVLRYIVSFALPIKAPGYVPWGTFAVNIIGSFLIGYMYHYTRVLALPLEWRLFVITGILGGFTTFSAFSIETLGMIERGHGLTAVAYAGSTVLLGLLAAWLGTVAGASH